MANDDFRKRWATPLLMLLGLLALIGLILFSVSRVLLAVPEMTATFTALLLAAYVLLVAGLISKYRRVSSRALGGGFVIGLVALLAAGLVAAQAGTRELHHFGDEPADEEPANGEPVDDSAIPDDAYVWVAFDLGFEDPPTSIPAGEATIAIDNTGNLPHDVTVDGEFQVAAQGGEQAWETVTLDAGEYYFYCSVPGHEASMNGTLVVD